MAMTTNCVVGDKKEMSMTFQICTGRLVVDGFTWSEMIGEKGSDKFSANNNLPNPKKWGSLLEQHQMIGSVSISGRDRESGHCSQIPQPWSLDSTSVNVYTVHIFHIVCKAGAQNRVKQKQKEAILPKLLKEILKITSVPNISWNCGFRFITWPGPKAGILPITVSVTLLGIY